MPATTAKEVEEVRNLLPVFNAAQDWIDEYKRRLQRAGRKDASRLSSIARGLQPYSDEEAQGMAESALSNFLHRKYGATKANRILNNYYETRRTLIERRGEIVPMWSEKIPIPGLREAAYGFEQFAEQMAAPLIQRFRPKTSMVRAATRVQSYTPTPENWNFLQRATAGAGGMIPQVALMEAGGTVAGSALRPILPRVAQSVFPTAAQQAMMTPVQRGLSGAARLGLYGVGQGVYQQSAQQGSGLPEYLRAAVRGGVPMAIAGGFGLTAPGLRFVNRISNQAVRGALTPAAYGVGMMLGNLPADIASLPLHGEPITIANIFRPESVGGALALGVGLGMKQTPRARGRALLPNLFSTVRVRPDMPPEQLATLMNVYADATGYSPNVAAEATRQILTGQPAPSSDAQRLAEGFIATAQAYNPGVDITQTMRQFVTSLAPESTPPTPPAEAFIGQQLAARQTALETAPTIIRGEAERLIAEQRAALEARAEAERIAQQQQERQQLEASPRFRVSLLEDGAILTSTGASESLYRLRQRADGKWEVMWSPRGSRQTNVTAPYDTPDEAFVDMATQRINTLNKLLPQPGQATKLPPERIGEVEAELNLLTPYAEGAKKISVDVEVGESTLKARQQQERQQLEVSPLFRISPLKDGVMLTSTGALESSYHLRQRADGKWQVMWLPRGSRQTNVTAPHDTPDEAFADMAKQRINTLRKSLPQTGQATKLPPERIGEVEAELDLLTPYAEGAQKISVDVEVGESTLDYYLLKLPEEDRINWIVEKARNGDPVPALVERVFPDLTDNQKLELRDYVQNRLDAEARSVPPIGRILPSRTESEGQRGLGTATERFLSDVPNAIEHLVSLLREGKDIGLILRQAFPRASAAQIDALVRKATQEFETRSAAQKRAGGFSKKATPMRWSGQPSEQRIAHLLRVGNLDTMEFDKLASRVKDILTMSNPKVADHVVREITEDVWNLLYPDVVIGEWRTTGQAPPEGPDDSPPALPKGPDDSPPTPPKGPDDSPPALPKPPPVAGGGEAGLTETASTTEVTPAPAPAPTPTPTPTPAPSPKPPAESSNPVADTARRLAEYWESKIGTYKTTSQGIDKPKGGGAGGTFTDINERRAETNAKQYRALADALERGMPVAKSQQEAILKAAKRLLKTQPAPPSSTDPIVAVNEGAKVKLPKGANGVIARHKDNRISKVMANDLDTLKGTDVVSVAPMRVPLTRNGGADWSNAKKVDGAVTVAQPKTTTGGGRTLGARATRPSSSGVILSPSAMAQSLRQTVNDVLDRAIARFPTLRQVLSKERVIVAAGVSAADIDKIHRVVAQTRPDAGTDIARIHDALQDLDALDRLQLDKGGLQDLIENGTIPAHARSDAQKTQSYQNLRAVVQDTLNKIFREARAAGIPVQRVANYFPRRWKLDELFGKLYNATMGDKFISDLQQRGVTAQQIQLLMDMAKDSTRRNYPHLEEERKLHNIKGLEQFLDTSSQFETLYDYIARSHLRKNEVKAFGLSFNDPYKSGIPQVLQKLTDQRSAQFRQDVENSLNILMGRNLRSTIAPNVVKALHFMSKGQQATMLGVGTALLQPIDWSNVAAMTTGSDLAAGLARGLSEVANRVKGKVTQAQWNNVRDVNPRLAELAGVTLTHDIGWLASQLEVAHGFDPISNLVISQMNKPGVLPQTITSLVKKRWAHAMFPLGANLRMVRGMDALTRIMSAHAFHSYILSQIDAMKSGDTAAKIALQELSIDPTVIEQAGSGWETSPKVINEVLRGVAYGVRRAAPEGILNDLPLFAQHPIGNLWFLFGRVLFQHMGLAKQILLDPLAKGNALPLLRNMLTFYTIAGLGRAVRHAASDDELAWWNVAQNQNENWLTILFLLGTDVLKEHPSIGFPQMVGSAAQNVASMFRIKKGDYYEPSRALGAGATFLPDMAAETFALWNLFRVAKENGDWGFLMQDLPLHNNRLSPETRAIINEISRSQPDALQRIRNAFRRSNYIIYGLSQLFAGRMKTLNQRDRRIAQAALNQMEDVSRQAAALMQQMAEGRLDPEAANKMMRDFDAALKEAEVVKLDEVLEVETRFRDQPQTLQDLQKDVARSRSMAVRHFQKTAMPETTRLRGIAAGGRVAVPMSRVPDLQKPIMEQDLYAEIRRNVPGVPAFNLPRFRNFPPTLTPAQREFYERQGIER